ncbi:MAG: hypothetical protein HYV27_15440 [Candidatus Hydrogenedentes bacterium]|nr:hypothetical protein [Candidatus Hydrogenedentota bacterium]
MRPILLSLFLLFTALSALADDLATLAPPPPGPPDTEWIVPELPSADMRLSWSDFRTLLQLLPTAAQTGREKPDPPPWPWAVTSARYHLDATDHPAVPAELSLEVEVWADAWTTIPLLGNSIAVSSVSIDGTASSLRDQDGWFTLLLKDPGHYRVDIAFFAQTVEADGEVTLQFPAVAAPVTEVLLLLGGDAAAVSSPNAARVTLHSNADGQEALLALKPAETLQLHWQRPSLVKEKLPPAPPRITADLRTQVRLSGGLLEGTARVNFEVLRGAVNRFALELPKDVVLLEVEGGDLEWTLEDEPAVQCLHLVPASSVSGVYPVTLRYEQLLAEDAGPVTLPKIVARDVARQSGAIGISTARNFSMEIAEPTLGVTRTDPEGQFALGLDWEILHAFRYSQTDYQLTVAAAVIQPRIAAETEMLASVSPTAFHVRANVHYRVLRGESSRLALALPAGVSVLSVTGPGMDWYAVDSDGGQRIEVELNEPLTDRCTVHLLLERNVENLEEAVPVPPVTVLDAVRQSTWIGIAAAGNVKVDVGADTAGLGRLDESELPAGVRALAESPILHAFSSQSPTFVLPLLLSRLDDVAVRVAAIDAAELTTVVSDEMLITRARYWVRNNQRQFLRIDPGPDVEIWGAQADGHAASPAKDPESEHGVLLPMRKSVEGAGGLGSFPMEIIFMQRPPLPRFGRLALALRAPATDILADRMAWTVYVPEGYRVSASAGDLAPVALPVILPSPNRGAMTLGNPETIYRLREGIERFFITDINNPAGSTAAQSKDFAGQTYAAAEAGEASVRLAGVLPVHINLPQTGVPHRFERALAPQGAALHLNLALTNARLIWAWAAASALSFFLLVLAIRFRAPLQERASAAAWRIALAILLAVACASLLQAPGIGAMAALVGLAAAEALIRLLRLRAGRAPRHTSTGDAA